MADLRVEDATLTNARAAFRAAGNRLGPVVWAVKGLNSEVVGAPPLAGRLQEANALLAAELGITGQALTELASRADEIGAAFGGVDQALAERARGCRDRLRPLLASPRLRSGSR